MSMEIVRTGHTTAAVIVALTIMACNAALERHARDVVHCETAPSGSGDQLLKFNENGYLHLDEAEDFDYDESCVETRLDNRTSSSVVAYYCDEGEVLLIAGGDLESLPSPGLLKKRSFDKYVIRENEISDVSGTAFRDISLGSLIIRNNDIIAFAGDTLECIDGLQNLTVKGNSMYFARNLYNPSVCSSTLTRLYIEANEVSFSESELLEANSTDGSGLPNLELLSFEGSTLGNLTANAFLWLKNTTLTSLNLRATNITHVDEDVLRPVQKTLKYLDLANASISLENVVSLMQGLQNSTAEPSSGLQTLSLAGLQLTKVPYDALKYVQYSLKALSLYGNDFASCVTKQFTYELFDPDSAEMEEAAAASQNATTGVYNHLLLRSNTTTGSHWSTFPQLPLLRELDLRSCNIDYIQTGSFENLENLRKLHISSNNILILYSSAFSGLGELLVLDISYNRYMSGRHSYVLGLTFENDTFSGLDSLKNLNMSRSRIAASSVMFLQHLPSTLEKLSVCGTGLTVLGDSIFGNLGSLTFLDLSRNFGLGADFYEETFTGLGELRELHLSGIALSDLSSLKNLTSLKYLNVRWNYVVHVQDAFSGMTLLEKLDLSCNYLVSWMAGRIFANNSNLSVVFLHNNSLSMMTDDMLQDLRSLSYVTLGNNQFVCTCNLKTFVRSVISADYFSNQTDSSIMVFVAPEATNTTVMIDYQNDSNHVCVDTSLTTTVQFTDTDEFCTDSIVSFLQSGLGRFLYIAIMVLLAVVSLGGLIYWKRCYISYFALLIKNATMLSIINAENDDDRVYTYDLFVSYCEENRDWVVRELIPNVEDAESGITICLHERDFEVGVSILENIIWGMDHSRTLLLVISNSFLKSQWCQFEMHLAQQRMLETCREELILVFLEDIPKRNRPKTLHYLMLTKTYIAWPKKSQDANAKKIFWKRLRKAIATVKRDGQNSAV